MFWKKQVEVPGPCLRCQAELDAVTKEKEAWEATAEEFQYQLGQAEARVKELDRMNGIATLEKEAAMTLRNLAKEERLRLEIERETLEVRYKKLKTEYQMYRVRVEAVEKIKSSYKASEALLEAYNEAQEQFCAYDRKNPKDDVKTAYWQVRMETLKWVMGLC